MELSATAPFYGAVPETAAVPAIKVPLPIHYAENDERIDAMAGLRERPKTVRHFLCDAQLSGHAARLHNNSTPRYQDAAKLAWERTKLLAEASRLSRSRVRNAPARGL